MNVDGFARLLTDYCLEVVRGPAGRDRVHDAGGAAAAGAAARDPGARRLAAAGRRAARAVRGLLAARYATRQLDTVPVGRSARSRVSSTRRCGSRPPTTPTRWPPSTRRGWRGPRARRRRCASCGWPSAGRSRCGRRPAAAQQAGMGTRELEDFVERALFLDRDDPVAAWGELRAFQAGLIARLAPAREIHILGEGTDLRLDVSDRVWVNSDGKRNMPSGEVFTGPHERSAEGVIRFTIPTSPRGVVVEDVTLGVPRGAGGERAGRARRRVPAGDARHRRRAPASSASSGSARTSASTARSARSSSTRRSAAPSTSRSARAIPRPAARTSPSCTGT